VASVDDRLLARTKELTRMFDAAENRLALNGDLRVFFTRSHGYITKKIGVHINLFKNPNSLMRLNDSFATTYLAAINGAPHHGWQQAFGICKALDDNAVRAKGLFNTIIMFPYAVTAPEECAGCMAKVHISQDLRNALIKVRDVDVEDYANILVFVIEGHLYAEVKLRGQILASAAFMVSVPFMDWLNTNAKLWRNEAFEQVYKKKVPDPSPAFIAAYHKAEHR
jgi:hypothetical protein